VPRRNNRDRRFEPKEYNNNEGKFERDEYDIPSKKNKPVRRRKDKWDKNIYREE